ncbi:MAG: DUF6265 family protein [Planctomycetota bacterium]
MLTTTLSLAMLASPLGAAHPDHATLDDASFMQGHWRSIGQEMLFEEVWLSPMGPVMSGHMRMGPPGGAPSLFELISITATDAGLTLRVSHFDTAHTPWEVEAKDGPVLLVAEASGEPNEIVFLDTTGQGRVDSMTYRLKDGGRLECAIVFTGAPDGEPFVIEFEPATN